MLVELRLMDNQEPAVGPDPPILQTLFQGGSPRTPIAFFVQGPICVRAGRFQQRWWSESGPQGLSKWRVEQ